MNVPADPGSKVLRVLPPLTPGASPGFTEEGASTEGETSAEPGRKPGVTGSFSP